MTDIGKTDWKIFKELRELALERFCSRVLDEIARIGSDQAKSKHERYLAIYRLIQERDREIDPIFDTLRRSSAVSQLCAFRVRELITEEEFRSLSTELRERIDNLIRIFNRPPEVVDEGIVDENDDANPR
jgi:hypothetical protein